MAISSFLKAGAIALPFGLLTSGAYGGDLVQQSWQVAQSDQEQQNGEEEMPSTEHQREVIEEDGESGQEQGGHTGGGQAPQSDEEEMPSTEHQREVIEEDEESGQQQ